MRSPAAVRPREAFALLLAILLAITCIPSGAFATERAPQDGSAPNAAETSDVDPAAQGSASRSGETEDAPSAEGGADAETMKDPVAQGSALRPAEAEGDLSAGGADDAATPTAPIAASEAAARIVVLPADTLSRFSVATITTGTVELAPEKGEVPTLQTTYVANGSAYVLDREAGEFALANAANAELAEEGYLVVPSGLILDGETYPVSAIAAGAFSGTEAPLVALPSSISHIDGSAFEGCEALQAVYVSPSNESYSSFDGCLYERSADETLSLMLIPGGMQGAVRIPSGAKVEDPEVFSHCASVEAIIVDAGSAATFPEDVEIKNANGDPIEIVIEDDADRTAQEDPDRADAVEADTGVESAPDDPESDDAPAVIDPDVAQTDDFADPRVAVVPDEAFAPVEVSGGNEDEPSAKAEAAEEPNRINEDMMLEITMDSSAENNLQLDERRMTASSVPPELANELFIFTVTNESAKTVSVKARNISTITGAIEIPSTWNGYTVTSIASSGFNGAVNLTSVALPDTIVTIGNSAFEACSNLAGVNIPNSVTYLGRYAFYSTALSNAFVPASVQGMQQNPFGNCTRLQAISVSDENPYFFDINGVLFGKGKGDEQTRLITYPAGKAGVAYEIPSVVQALDHYAFKRAKITRCTIPEKISGDVKVCSSESFGSYTQPAVGACVFQNCLNLRVIYSYSTSALMDSSGGVLGSIASNVEVYVKDEATRQKWISCGPSPAGNVKIFEDKSRYFESVSVGGAYYARVKTAEVDNISGDVVIPSIIEGHAITGLANNAFSGAKKVTSVCIPEGVVYIGNGAFDYTSGIQAISIPSTVTDIGMYAFCGTGIGSVFIPSNVVDMGRNPFLRCSNLLTIDVADDNAHFYSRDGVLYGQGAGDSGMRLICYPPAKQARSYDVIDGTVSLDYYSFADSTLETISLPASLSGNVKTTSYDTSYYNGLGGVTFQNCHNLKSIFSYTDNEITSTPASGGLFGGVPSDQVTVYVKSETIKAEWVRCGFRDADKVIVISDNSQYFEKVDVSDGTCRIRVKEDKRASISGVVVVPSTFSGKTVSGVAANGFLSCPNITSVQLPATTTYIGDDAFENCSNLSNVNIPDGTEYIGTYAFGSTRVGSVAIPASVERMGMNPFLRCEGLTGITVDKQNAHFYDLNGVLFGKGTPDAVMRMISYPLAKQSTNYTVPEFVESTDHYVFCNNVNLQSVTLPASLKDSSNRTGIGACAFQGCTSLESVYSYAMCSMNLGSGGNFRLIEDKVIVYCYESVKEAWLKHRPKQVVLIDGVQFIVKFSGNTTDPTLANVPQAIAMNRGDRVTAPSNPTRRGYGFLGWYLNEEGTGDPYDFSAGITQTVQLYAKWGLATYAIKLDKGDGSAVQTINYTMESDDITIDNPVREGYTFHGWTGTELEEPTIDLTIESNSVGDRSYVATWVPHTYSIEFDLAFEGASWKDGEAPEAGAYDAVEYDAAVTFPKAPARKGWIFQEWRPADAEASKEGYAAGEEVPAGSANFKSGDGDVAKFEAAWTRNLKVTVPVGSKAVDLEVTADWTDHSFKVEGKTAQLVNLSDGELEVAAVGEDASDADALAARKANAVEAFGGASADESKLEGISLTMQPTSDGADSGRAGELARFRLFGKHELASPWKLAASTDPVNGTEASTLRIRCGMEIDQSKVKLEDLKIGLQGKPIASILYTVQLADKTEPSYTSEG